MRLLPLTVIVVIALAVPAFGASSFFGGYSGSIFTPDGIVVPQGSWDWSYHDFTGDSDLQAFGVTYGLLENLEVGASFLDNGDNETALNAKLELVPETAQRPAILVGVFDLADTLDLDPGFYVVFSKNITPIASEIVDEPSKPLRLSAGFGSGVFDGFFAGLDWTLQPQLSLMAEYVDSDFNAGIRYAATDALRLDAALVDLDDFAFGASYRIAL